MPSIPFQKTWTDAAGNPINLVAPDGMTVAIADDTTGQTVVTAAAMINYAPGQYEYALDGMPGHKYTAVYTVVYQGQTYVSPPFTVSLAQPLPPKPPSPADLLNQYMAAAVAALANGDYATAINNALAAQGMAAILPRISRGGGSGGGDMSASWDAQGIDNFVRRLRQQQGAALGVQVQQVVISEPTPLDQGEQFANASGGYIQ